jgi:iron(III) transport system ATP-binding protein
VLLLDEPFASLDHNLRIKVRAEVTAILRAAGTPSVFVTHDRVEALALGDRVIVMNGGRVLQDGTPDEVFHRPTNRFVAQFLGEADFLPATLVDGMVETELGRCPAPDAAIVEGPAADLAMVVRPDDVTFTTADPSETGLAEVVAAEFQGSFVLYELRLTSGGTVRVRRGHGARVSIGATVRPVLTSDSAPTLVSS